MAERGQLGSVGKYPVVRKLGEGATSEVYLCRDPFNDREPVDSSETNLSRKAPR